jgi:hypothetical protein
MSQDDSVTAVAPHVDVPSTHDPKIDTVDFKFTFRKDEYGNTRPAVEVKVPVPSIEGLADIYNNGGKGLSILHGLVIQAISDHIRGLLNDDANITTTNFPYDKATWQALVDTPEAEKRGRGIPKEIWEAFLKDYVAQMPAVQNKTKEQVEAAGKLLYNKFQPVKTDKQVVALLKDYVTIYMNQTPNAEEFADVIKFLMEKADTLLKAEEKNLAEYL